MNLAPAGQYERLKEELSRILAETDSDKVARLVQNEVVGDRKPSQFYHGLKKLTSPYASDQFILTLWRNRLPPQIRQVVAVVDDSNVEKLIRAADDVEEVYARSGHREANITAVTTQEAQNVGATDSVAAAITSLTEQLAQMRTSMEVTEIDIRRRNRSRSPRRYRRSSRFQVSPGQDGLCYYHLVYRERARKCRAPCNWAQGNASSRP
jgi:hypothetical protein